MISVDPQSSAFQEPAAAWYCIHTKPKSEHIATAHLKLLEGIDVFCPRIRYQKSTRRGKVWFVEAMFPGYTFAHCDLGQWLRAINAANAVLGVVRFGEKNYPPVPSSVVEECRRLVGDDAVITLREEWKEGDEVEVLEGPARGIQAIITKVMPGKERVRILMEILGQSREVEISPESLSRKESNIRAAAAKSSLGES